MRFRIAGPLLVLGYTAFAAQLPPRPAWAVLNDKSSAVILGLIGERFAVLRKQTNPPKVIRLPNGNIIEDLPNMDEMSVGWIVRVTVKDIFKKDGTIKPGKTLDLFIPADMHEERPVLPVGQTYLLFIKPIEPGSPAFKGEYITPVDRYQKLPLESADRYEVVLGIHGSVRITDENADIVDQVRATIRQAK